MCNTKVCVLVSTYNGEKFIKEQLDSLLSQEEICLSIVVRDDGSSDKTLSILQTYSTQDSRISYYQGSNIGPTGSFFELVDNAPESDYYAYSDQDDVWDKNKLKIAVDLLEKEESMKPNLYYSNLRVVNEEMTFFRNSHSVPLVQNKKYGCLVENMSTGCTTVFNAKTRNYIQKLISCGGYDKNYYLMHDAWTYIICKIFGNVVYDFNPHISYRQHENNVVGTSLKLNAISYKNKFWNIFKSEGQPRSRGASLFLECFKNELQQDELKEVLKLANYKYSIRNRIALLFDKEICMHTWITDFCYRIQILIGQV
ncbi:MAG: glycosyltransferase family 2 protein [Bacteroides thetaiotaomicron]|nr:glycosyltransferase family 2 protein [Bacteroides thetaiotaomicron]